MLQIIQIILGVLRSIQVILLMMFVLNLYWKKMDIFSIGVKRGIYVMLPCSEHHLSITSFFVLWYETWHGPRNFLQKL